MDVIGFQAILCTSAGHPMHARHSYSPGRRSDSANLFQHLTGKDVQYCCARSPLPPTICPVGLEIEENTKCYGTGSHGYESRSENESPFVDKGEV